MSKMISNNGGTKTAAVSFNRVRKLDEVFDGAIIYINPIARLEIITTKVEYSLIIL